MIDRPYWQSRIQDAWREAPIVWLSGVRRSGKTTLASSLPSEGVLHLDCDLPSTAAVVADPELFYRSCGKSVVVFDEIHQIPDPSRLLKIAADHFPGIRVLATGSSTLAATRKFRDSLTGRKRQVHLFPVLWDEFSSFGASLQERLHRGGLPPALLGSQKRPAFYREWVDSFFARDVQRLFAVRGPERFTALFEYFLRQSGGLYESVKTASALGISRPTVGAYLRAMEITQAVTILRPYSGGSRKELVKTPKIYGFDTGFVSFFRGWDTLRPSDFGSLWEHLVLEWLQARLPDERIFFWRDKSGRELDFVVPRSRGRVDALECKWDSGEFDPGPLVEFRKLHPEGDNFLVCPNPGMEHKRRVRGLVISVCDPSGCPGGSQPA